MRFDITGTELDKFIEWSRKHEHADVGAIGGRYTFSFTPTSLGTAIEVEDAVTKEKINITDYDLW